MNRSVNTLSARWAAGVAALAMVVALVAAMLAPAVSYADEAWMQEEARIGHVTDEYGLLSGGEIAALESVAQAIEDQYGFGAYVIVVYDYRDFSQASVFDAAVALYKGCSLGVGEGKDGVLLLLSMYDRDYSFITYGELGNYAFNDEGRAAMTEFFLDDFSENYWYDGFADFFDWTERYLEAAAAGEPYSGTNIPVSDEEIISSLLMLAALIVVVPLVIMFVVIRIMDGKMKSVAAATHASHYVVGGAVLTDSRDSFSHTTETAVRIQSENKGGGSFSSHSGGFSGTSGKF